MADEMNKLLSEFFGTGQDKTASAEDQEKLAQVELFSKLAAEEGIDIEKLSDDQVKHLWAATFSEKTAAATETPAPAADVEKRAEAEFAEKRAAATKIAEAEFLGKVMAHAMVQELGKIGEATKTAAAAGGQPTVRDRLLKVAGELPPWLNKGKGDKDGDKDDKGDDKDKGDKKAPPFGKKDDKDEKKEASAIDHKAAEVAVKIAKDAGLNVEEATKKVAAVLTLGPKESTKIAAAPDFQTGLHIRGLELLEQAGYPVQWESAQ